MLCMLCVLYMLCMFACYVCYVCYVCCVCCVCYIHVTCIVYVIGVICVVYVMCVMSVMYVIHVMCVMYVVYFMYVVYGICVVYVMYVICVMSVIYVIYVVPSVISAEFFKVTAAASSALSRKDKGETTKSLEILIYCIFITYVWYHGTTRRNGPLNFAAKFPTSSYLFATQLTVNGRNKLEILPQRYITSLDQ